MGDSSSTDYNGNGFDQGGDGAVFGDPGSDPGSVSDYDTWDWKQIEAAINGMSAGVDNSGNQDHAQAVSDPASLQAAADAFYTVQQTLSDIAKSLSDQANALAGPNGPWTGDAADSFIDMMSTFSKQVAATANVLSGGTTGAHSVPQQLADNAVNLQNAQTKISEIDSWYANQAILMGVKPMSNGLIPISQKPQLVDMMTSDMRAVLKSLASEYQVTIDAVRPPQAITSPGDNAPNTDDPNNPADAGPDPADALPVSADTGVLPDSALADSPAAFPADLSTAGAGGLPDSGALDPSALDAALNPNAGTVDPSAFPDGTDVGGDPSAFPGGTDVGDPSSLPDGTDVGGDPSSFPGGTDVGDDLSPLSPTAFPGGLSTVGGLPLGDEDDVADPLADDVSPESFPDDLSTGGVGGLPGGDDLGDDLGAGSPAGFPGGLSTESGVPDGLDTALPGETGTATGDGGADSGMPYMPGMGGAAGQSGDQAGERSDASGLLDGDAEPWEGSPDVGDGVGSALGAAAGGTGLDLPGAGVVGDELPTAEEAGADGGMPYMPGMGGAAGQSGDQAGERSDASGLLDGDTEPWEGSSDAGDGVGSELGAAAGGTGLDLPGAEDESDSGMPYMPGMGGAAGQSGDRAGERSDASGLLEGDADPWESEPEAPEEVGSALGAAAGAAAFNLLVASAVAATAPAPEPAGHQEPAQVLTEEAVWTDEPEAQTEAGARTEAEARTETEAQTEAEAEADIAVESELLPVIEHGAAALVGQAENDGAEETAAWDAAGESLVPLLWGLVNEDEEGDVLSSGYATAEDETWTGRPGDSAAAPASGTGGDPGDPGWATWRPNRNPSPADPTGSRLSAGGGASASCSADAFDEVEEPEPVESEPEPAASRSIADLLVQDGDTWGSVGPEESDVLL